MPKIAFFPLNTQGLNSLETWQKEHEVINFRAVRVQTEPVNPGQYSRDQGVWCLAVLYIEKSDIHYPEADDNGKRPTTPKKSKDSST